MWALRLNLAFVLAVANAQARASKSVVLAVITRLHVGLMQGRARNGYLAFWLRLCWFARVFLKTSTTRHAPRVPSALSAHERPNHHKSAVDFLLFWLLVISVFRVGIGRMNCRLGKDILSRSRAIRFCLCGNFPCTGGFFHAIFC